MDGLRDDPVVEEVREHFTVKRLQERVWRLEAENKELKQSNYILDSQLASQRETQADILNTLHQNLDENNTKIEAADNTIRDLEGQNETLIAESKEKLEEERQTWQDKVSELTMKNEHLTASLEEVKQFRQEKEQVEAELASLRQKLEEQSENHFQELAAFERKKAIEIDSLRRDMQRSVKETREILKLRTKDQLDTTTKRTIMENEQMATEIHFQSKETEKLLDRNNKLMD